MKKDDNAFSKYFFKRWYLIIALQFLAVIALYQLDLKFNASGPSFTSSIVSLFIGFLPVYLLTWQSLLKADYEPKTHCEALKKAGYKLRVRYCPDDEFSISVPLRPELQDSPETKALIDKYLRVGPYKLNQCEKVTFFCLVGKFEDYEDWNQITQEARESIFRSRVEIKYLVES